MKNVFPQFWKLEVQVQDGCLVGFWLQWASLLLCPMVHESFLVSVLEGHPFHHKGSTFLIESPPDAVSLEGLGFNTRILKGYRHSNHSIYSMCLLSE
jgi:hypothetical protein